LRLNDAILLSREYLQERPNDEQARNELMSTAFLASDTNLSRETLEHFKERGITNQVDAGTYMGVAYQVFDPSEVADYGLQALQRWPNGNALIYQTHRTLLWAGRILEAKELADRHSRLYAEDGELLRARQACAEGRRADAEAIYVELDPNDTDNNSTRWHISKLLGNEQQAIEILSSYADSGVPYMMTSWLHYQQFDPTPFPSIMAVLEREGVDRPAAVDIPFKCPPPE